MQLHVCTYKDEKPDRERKLIKGSERKSEHLLLKEEKERKYLGKEEK
jgi:hypothetical protein